MEAWAAYDRGQLAILCGNDPPHWLLEGVLLFDRELEKCRADVMRLERLAREAATHGG